MIILINRGPNPFKVEYRDGTKAFIKQFPINSVVAMKGLDVVEQISNRNSLAQNGVTMYNFETRAFYGTASALPTGTTMPFVFIGNDVKPTEFTSIVGTGFSGTTTASAMTFTANAIPASTVYGFVTSANTAMANGAISAVTIGNNRYVSFSGASLTTVNWYSAILSGAPLTAGITITGTGTGSTIGAGTSFFLSASTTQTRAGYVYLQRLV